MTERLAAFYRRNFRAVVVLTMLVLALLAWSNRFIQDDAFISFRYAEHLVQGKGLVFNEGERVEGYTNFLWTLLIAAGLFVSIDPVVFSQVLGLIFFALSLLLTYRLSHLVFRAKEPALLAVILLGTNYTFSAYATGGLETQLQACLCVAAACLALQVVRIPGTGPITEVAFSLLTAAALLTRLDSAVYLLVLFPAVFFTRLRRSSSRRQRCFRAARLCLAPLVIVGSWLAWKLAYYGDVLPNTFYVKAGSTGSLWKGLTYCGVFVRSYWLIPIALAVLVGAGKISREKKSGLGVTLRTMAVRFLEGLKVFFRERQSGIRLIVLTTAVWWLYVIEVGGDFMEFRFFVPAMPLLAVLVTWLLFRFVGQPAWRTPFAAAVLFCSLLHGLLYPGGHIESIAQLHGHVKNPHENWERVGKVLGELFYREDCKVVLATTAAGAIPYYSRLPTVDMLGLNDPWVAREGVAVEGKPGHEKMASLNYLIRRGVHLDVGHPTVTSRGYRAAPPPSDAADSRLPAGSKYLEIPLDENYKITVLYLVPNKCVDEVIRRHRLKTYAASRQKAGLFMGR